MYESLKAEVARIKLDRGLTYKDLSALTNFSPNALAKFMGKKGRSANIARALASALGIRTVMLSEEKIPTVIQAVSVTDPELGEEIKTQIEEVTKHGIDTHL